MGEIPRRDEDNFITAEEAAQRNAEFLAKIKESRKEKEAAARRGSAGPKPPPPPPRKKLSPPPPPPPRKKLTTEPENITPKKVDEAGYNISVENPTVFSTFLKDPKKPEASVTVPEPEKKPARNFRSLTPTPTRKTEDSFCKARNFSARSSDDC